MESSIYWNLKDKKGRIFGPFSTQKIIDLIKRGTLDGEEYISPKNAERWTEIAKHPEFYDVIIETLKGEQKKYSDDEISKELTRSQEVNVSPKEENHKKRGRAIIEETTSKKTEPRQTNQSSKAEPPIIELKEEAVYLKKENTKNFKIIAGVCILLTAVLFFFYEELFNSIPTSEERIHLLYPGKPTSKIDLSEEQEAYQRALAEFQKDTFGGYYKAQQQLVKILEANAKSLDSISLLCLTYRELWPYTFQDSTDLQSLTRLVQKAQGEDSLGIHGAICRAVQSSLTADNQIMDTLLQTLLNDFPTASVLYEIKGQVLHALGQTSTAIAYVQKTQSLWPRWHKPFFLEAQMRIAIQDYYNAAKILKSVLDQNKSHTKSQVELGILELTQFKNKKGLDYILIGLEDVRLPNDVRVRGYTALTNYYYSMDPNKALKFAQRAFSFDPKNSYLRTTILTLGGEGALNEIKSEESQLMVLGDNYFKNKSYLAAQAEYKTAFELNPKNALAALKAAESLWGLNRSNEAIDWAVKALRSDPKMIEPYVLLADYHSQKYDFKIAADYLVKAKAETKINYQILRAYAQLELRRKNSKTAMKYAEQALKFYDSDVESLNILSESYMQMNQFEKAYQYSAKSVSLDTNNPRSQEIYARTLLGMRGIGAAEEYLKNLIRTYPDNLDYRTSLGMLYIKDERYNDAIEELKQVVETNPNQIKALMFLGETYSITNQPNEALKTYYKAASIDPAGAEPIFYIAQIYLKSKVTAPKAIKNFQKVIEINPRYPKAHYFAGQAALLMGMTKQAIEFAEKEKRINPLIADPYILLADVYYTQQKYSQAATELRRAVQIRPDDPSLYIQLAKNYRLSGQLDVATSMLRVASSKESGNADIYREQGAVFEKQGLRDQAVSSYARYLELKPNAEDKSDVERRIQNMGGSQ